MEQLWIAMVIGSIALPPFTSFKELHIKKYFEDKTRRLILSTQHSIPREFSGKWGQRILMHDSPSLLLYMKDTPWSWQKKKITNIPFIILYIYIYFLVIKTSVSNYTIPLLFHLPRRHASGMPSRNRHNVAHLASTNSPPLALLLYWTLILSQHSTDESFSGAVHNI